jgi:hypothetical protein
MSLAPMRLKAPCRDDNRRRIGERVLHVSFDDNGGQSMTSWKKVVAVVLAYFASSGSSWSQTIDKA